MKSAVLLIDNSNTRTKFALWDGVSLSASRTLYTAELSVPAITALVSDWKFEKLCLCSVVPAAAELIRKYAAGCSVFELNAEVAQGVDFSSYPGVATLGADRVANVLAALEYAPLPLVAIDAGTATTFDVVEKGNSVPCFAGGLIAPGLSAVAGCLHSKTAQLPQCEPVEGSPIIGRNTQEAMSSAIAVGYPGMVDSIVDGIEKELGEAVHVLLTGGDAEWLASRMRRDVRIVPDLTLQGIAKAALLM